MIPTYMVKCFLTKLPRPFNGGKYSLFNKRYWANCISTCKSMKVDTYLTPLGKNWHKSIKGLTIRTKTLRRKYRGKTITLKRRCYFSVYRLTTVKKFFIKYRVDNRLRKRILFHCTVNGRINWLDFHCSPCSRRQRLRFCTG